MDKKLLGQGMAPVGTEANDTLFFHEYELSKEMVVCQECGEIGGLIRLRGRDSGGRFHNQTCYCKDKRETPQAREELLSYFRLDFTTAVTLCACCGQELIKTGSKFSSFFCDFCRKLIYAFDRKRGITIIPMGRHSFMNGVLLNGRDAQNEPAVTRFVEGMSSMFKRIELLKEWTNGVIAENIKMTGHDWGNHVGLFDYLSEMPRDFRSRHRAFLGLRKFFLKRCEVSPETSSTGGDSSMVLGGAGQDDQRALGQAAGAGAAVHQPEAEIRCSSYVLVARVQAVRSKWRGGLGAYLRKYSCQFNEVIATNSAATLEFDDQLVDLAENGLEMDRDFTIIHAGKTAPPEMRVKCAGWSEESPERRAILLVYTGWRLKPKVDIVAENGKRYRKGESITGTPVSGGWEVLADTASRLSAIIPKDLVEATNSVYSEKQK